MMNLMSASGKILKQDMKQVGKKSAINHEGLHEFSKNKWQTNLCPNRVLTLGG